jgi:large subunit ribosomal protein L17e
MTLNRARAFLNNVIEHKEAVPFRRFAKSIGRSKQSSKAFGCPRGRWPVKSAKFVLDLLANAKANAEAKGLDTSKLKINHIQANMAV